VTVKNKASKRRTRIRAKLRRVANRPRLSVFRSNKAIYAQLIDDEKMITLVSASESDLPTAKKKKTKTEKSKLVGEILAERALKKNLKKIVFDRGSFSYRGRVKALADGAREKGLEF